MQDHLGINYYFKANKPTMNNVLGRWPGRIMAGIEYVLRKTGPLSLSVNQIGGLVKTDPSLDVADAQIYANPVSYQIKFHNQRPLLKPDKFPGFILGFNSCRPASAGRITITSEKASTPPEILGNYMTHQKDIDDVVKMARFVGQLQNTPAIQQILSASPDMPLDQMSDDDIVADFKERCGTIFHPSCTCRMGTSVENSVVNSDLKVHDIDGLRVVDASVFPNITSANINAPTIMVAHKAAQSILDEAKRPVR
jgi:choline dehydrogenase